MKKTVRVLKNISLNKPNQWLYKQLEITMPSFSLVRNMSYCLLLMLPMFISAQTGPGGIGTTDGTSILEYWIDANHGVSGSNPITVLSDLSGNNVNNAINGDPVLTTNVLNGYSAMTLDGNGDYIRTNLSVNSNVFPDLSVIAVYTPRVNNAGGVWGEDNGSWDRFILDKAGSNPALGDMVSYGHGPISNVPNIFPVATPVITTVIFRENVSNGSYVYANNAVELIFGSDHGPGSSSPFTIGDIGSLSSSYDFDGDIAELIIYGTAINTAQRIIIDNYLSAKYGLSLSSNDLYDEDDVANGNYDHELAGIGRIDASNVHQDAQGTAILRLLNPTDLDDGEFLMWGHDKGLLEMTETTDIPASLDARLDRVWRASEVNTSNTAVDIGAVDLRFDLTDMGPIVTSDLVLLVDSDNDGSFDDETPIGGATSIGANTYEFAGVTALSNNRRFTIGVSNGILPIDLLSFEAQVLNGQSVKLLWVTASETDNDYFTVERSKDGLEWDVLGRVNAVGNSSQIVEYSIEDNQPYQGISYYRLKQTDIDGRFSYTFIESININQVESAQIHLYPNPTKGEIRIVGLREQANSIEVYNALSQNVSSYVGVHRITDEYINLDLSALVAGVYYVKIGASMHKVYRQ